MPETTKPQKQVFKLYDFNECTKYLEAKYNIEIRDYAGRFTNDDVDVPYQDFWHFILDNADISDGSIVGMSGRWFDDAEDWQKTIGNYYLDEFGEEDADGERVIEFYVWRK